MISLLAVRVLLDVQFWFPTWMIFLLERGFSPLEAALADAIFHAAIVVAEVPMGRLADRIGRKATLLATCAATIVVFSGIAMVSSLGGLFLVWALWGVLWALASGIDTAYAWELVETRHPEVTPSRYLGWTRAVAGVAGFVSLLTAGFLLDLWAPLPYLVTALFALVALLIALRVPSIPRLPGPRRSVGRGRAHARARWSFLRSPGVAWGIGLGATVSIIGISIRILFQPLGIDGGLTASQISICYALFALAVGLGGYLGGRLATRGRARFTLLALALMSVLLTATGLGATAMSGWVTLGILVPVSGVFFAVGKTITDIWVVSSVPAVVRATALSVSSALSGLAMAGIRPVLVLVSETNGLGIAFIGWGVLCLAASFAVLLLLARARSRREHPAMRA